MKQYECGTRRTNMQGQCVLTISCDNEVIYEQQTQTALARDIIKGLELLYKASNEAEPQQVECRVVAYSDSDNSSRCTIARYTTEKEAQEHTRLVMAHTGLTGIGAYYEKCYKIDNNVGGQANASD